MKKRRLSALLLAIVLALTSLPVFAQQLEQAGTPTALKLERDAVPETLAYENAVASGYVKRLYDEEESLNTAVFLNADGSRSMLFFDENIKYADDAGIVRDKSTQLTKTRNGYTNEQNDIRVVYPTSIADGVTISYEKYEISMKPLSFQAASQSVRVSAAYRDGKTNRASYDGVFGEGSELVYIQTLSGVKEEIVLDKDIGRTAFSFELRTAGLRLTSEKNRTILVDAETKKEVGELGALVMWDASGLEMTGSYKITENAPGIYTLTLDASALLNREDVVYPVTVDPSMTITQVITKIIEDATIFSTYWIAEGSHHQLFVGNYNAYSPDSMPQRGIARTLVKFPELETYTYFNNLYASGLINSVKYNFSNIVNPTQSNTIQAYIYNNSWTETGIYYSSVAWNSFNSTAGFVGKATLSPKTSFSAPFPRYEIDITKAVDAWKSGTANNGIIMKAVDESTAKPAVVLGSSDSSGPDGGTGNQVGNRPYIVVNYGIKNQTIYRIRNVASGKYMTVDGAYDENNRNIYQSALNEKAYRDDDEDSVDDYMRYDGQEFRVVYDANEGAYRLFAICSMNGRRRVVDVVLSSGTYTNNVQLYNNTESGDNRFAQLFYFDPVGTNQFRIQLVTNRTNGVPKYLTANGTGSGSGTEKYTNSPGNIYIADESNNDDQKWVFVESNTNAEEDHYAAMEIRYPLDVTSANTIITSDFGPRDITNGSSEHGGIDIDGASTRTDYIYSVIEGKVIYIGYEEDSELGYYIIIEATDEEYNVYGSDTKLRFVYEHLRYPANQTNSKLSEGYIVKAGDKIGVVGKSSKYDIGTHLHFGVIVDGGYNTGYNNCIDPLMFYPDIAFTYS